MIRFAGSRLIRIPLPDSLRSGYIDKFSGVIERLPKESLFSIMPNPVCWASFDIIYIGLEFLKWWSRFLSGVPRIVQISHDPEWMWRMSRIPENRLNIHYIIRSRFHELIRKISMALSLISHFPYAIQVAYIPDLPNGLQMNAHPESFRYKNPAVN